MPDPASSNLFTHYVLENPWPVGGVLAVIAAILTWNGLREGLATRLRLGLALGLVAGGIIAAGILVTTPAEHGLLVARNLVDAAVNRDVVSGVSLFSDDAMMNVGSPQNPGFDRDFIQTQFSRLANGYVIESNSITVLRGATLSSSEAEIRLGCMTTVSSFPYPNTSQWIMRVRLMPDGSWKITRLTCVAINDRTPPLDRLW